MGWYEDQIKKMADTYFNVRQTPFFIINEDGFITREDSHDDMVMATQIAMNELIDKQRTLNRAMAMKNNKTTAELVAEIHADFDTEVDRLLEFAKIQKPVEANKDLIHKADRLLKLGFYRAKTVKESEEEMQRISSIVDENRRKERLWRAINYFSDRYPYKFITNESVNKLCEKYNLVFGPSTVYKGDIPEKNITDIENFKVMEEDECYFLITPNEARDFRNPKHETVRAISYNESKLVFHDENGVVRSGSVESQRLGTVRVEKAGFCIVAPVSDFDMTDKQVKNFAIVNKAPAPDPIVLAPVMFENTQFYLIVTAWGPEASDESVVNEKSN